MTNPPKPKWTPLPPGGNMTKATPEELAKLQSHLTDTVAKIDAELASPKPIRPLPKRLDTTWEPNLDGEVEEDPEA